MMTMMMMMIDDCGNRALTLQPRLATNSLCSPDWPWTSANSISDSQVLGFQRWASVTHCIPHIFRCLGHRELVIFLDWLNEQESSKNMCLLAWWSLVAKSSGFSPLYLTTPSSTLEKILLLPIWRQRIPELVSPMRNFKKYISGKTENTCQAWR